MTPAEVQLIVRKEVDRMFGGDEDVIFTEGRGQPNKLFYDRFLEVMTALQRSLSEINQRVATIEHRMYDLEQIMRQRGNKLS